MFHIESVAQHNKYAQLVFLEMLTDCHTVEKQNRLVVGKQENITGLVILLCS